MMKTLTIYFSAVLCILLIGKGMQAQTPSAVIDKNIILIGEQAILRLSVPFDKNKIPVVKWPSVGDTIVTRVEVVSKTEVDTLKTGQEVREARLEQQIVITSFDTGYYAIPPFVFEIDGNLVQTDAFLFTVHTVEIDTTGGIKDIREIEEIEVNWRDYVAVYWPYAAGAAGGLLLIGAVIYLVRQLREKRKAKALVKVLEPSKPIHMLAIERLEQLRRDRYYTVGKVKLHHTVITDTLRDYIEKVYNIPAHELTSRQMISSLRYSGMETRWLNTLSSILTTADLVKFAKEKPDDVENEAAVSRAIEFVRSTWELTSRTLPHSEGTEPDQTSTGGTPI